MQERERERETLLQEKSFYPCLFLQESLSLERDKEILSCKREHLNSKEHEFVCCSSRVAREDRDRETSEKRETLLQREGESLLQERERERETLLQRDGEYI